jgi:hypothetical protein
LFRIKLKFVKNIIFYSTPENPVIVLDLLALTQNTKFTQTISKEENKSNKDIPRQREEEDDYNYLMFLYTTYEKMQMQRILGTSIWHTICHSKQDTFKFY